MTAAVRRLAASRPSFLRMVDRPPTYRLLGLLIFALAWQGFASASGSLLIAPFTETLGAAVVLSTDPRLWNAFAISLQAMVIGFAIALAVGIPMGLALGRFRRAEAYTNVYLNILLVIPMSMLIPLLIMSVGIGLASRVTLVVIAATIVIVINCRAGMRQVDPSVVDMARSFGASELKLWRRVLIPGALPAIMTGVRLGLSRSVEAMVLVELLMVAVGLGNLLLIFRGQFDAASLYATVLYIVALGLVLITTLRWVERRATPWARTAGLSPRSRT
jgi:NitT/TauT family transport system permease protein